MIPFLKSVARAYATRYSDLSEFCFLFPNKRSGTFFLKYLREEISGRVILSPEIKSISDFVSEVSGRVPASKLDLLLGLYDCYRKLYAKEDAEAADFDSFRTWGETVVSDFNEVDLYLADPEEIFKNVKDYREISSTFLTEEQKAVMKEYFGVEEFSDGTRMWKQFNDPGKSLSKAKSRFLYLWQMLGSLYESLDKTLEKKGLASNGGMYRLALERLETEGRYALPWKKVVAVGFNALSASEWGIFNAMNKFMPHEGMDSFIDFFWDSTGPVFEGGTNSASKFVKANIRKFPCPEWALPTLKQSDTDTMPPKISVIAAPSNSSQTKIAGTLVGKLHNQLGEEAFKDARVAVVLPDEGLLLPMLYSLPRNTGDVNLTMGYPLRLTSAVPFVSLLRRVVGGRRKENGELAFYHRDIRQLSAHPFIHAIDGTKGVNNLIGYLDKYHKSAATISEISFYLPKLAPLLSDMAGASSAKGAISSLDALLEAAGNSLAGNNGEPIKPKLEEAHIRKYRDALLRMGDLLEEYDITMKPTTLYRLVDRLLAGVKVGFEGEPLTGLQVMGTLETRSLDFDHIFILSANERVMPMRARTKSFIPDSLRRAYGMPPSNYAEEIFAYYFFRMISRAKEVTLVYDARSGGGIRTAGESRYIYQLRHLFAKYIIKEYDWSFILSGKVPYDPSIEKDESILKRLEPFSNPVVLMDNGKADPAKTKFFSASSLMDYRQCQVAFFYKHGLGINPDPPKSEYIDAIGVGNILHDVMSRAYISTEQFGKYIPGGVAVTRDKIQELIRDRDNLWKMIVRAVNKLHFNRPEEELDAPLGKGPEMVGKQIMEQIKQIFKRDLELVPFRILGCEISEQGRLELPSGREVNFKLKIDRLDEIVWEGSQRLRIVDYKTGSPHLEAEDMNDLVNGGFGSKHAFQLFTYAWLHNKLTGNRPTNGMLLEIYEPGSFVKKDKNRKQTKYPEIGGVTVTDYFEYSEEFEKEMLAMIDGIFDSPVFKAPESKNDCIYCPMKTLCRRN